MVELIMGWLKSGELSVGEKLPSERDLAKRLGVSLHTVNKAIARLSDAKILSSSAGRGTHVKNQPANDAVAVLCDSRLLSASFHAPSIDLLLETLLAEAKNRSFIPHFMVGRGDDTQSYIDSLGINSSVWEEVKGVVSRGWREGVEERLAARGVPMITITAKRRGRHAVSFDYGALGKLAASTLLDGSPAKLCAILSSEPSENGWNDPLESFKAELRQAGFPLERLSTIQAGASPEDAPQACARHETDLTEADGIFISDDNTAAGYAKWLRSAKNASSLKARVVSQASEELDLGFPGNFELLAFSLTETATKAMSMLEGLKSGKLDPEKETREWIKPRKFKFPCESNPAFSSAINHS